MQYCLLRMTDTGIVRCQKHLKAWAPLLYFLQSGQCLEAQNLTSGKPCKFKQAHILFYKLFD